MQPTPPQTGEKLTPPETEQGSEARWMRAPTPMDALLTEAFPDESSMAATLQRQQAEQAYAKAEKATAKLVEDAPATQLILDRLQRLTTDDEQPRRGKHAAEGDDAFVQLCELARRYPDPRDLLAYMHAEEEALAQHPEEAAQIKNVFIQFADELGEESVDFQSSATMSPKKRIATLAFFAPQKRHVAYEQLMQTLYGERWRVFKRVHHIEDAAEVWSDVQPAVRASVVTPIEAWELKDDHLSVELSQDDESLLDERTMARFFGIDGELLGTIELGEGHNNVSLGILKEGNEVDRGRHAAAQFSLLAMHDGEFVGQALPLETGQEYVLGRAEPYGPYDETPPSTWLNTMLQGTNLEVPRTVSRRQCKVTTENSSLTVAGLRSLNNTTVRRAVSLPPQLSEATAKPAEKLRARLLKKLKLHR